MRCPSSRAAALAAAVAFVSAGAVVVPATQETSSSIVLTPEGEPGEPLVMSGTIYRQDGVTPAEGVDLEVWHTDVTGHYSPDGGAVPRLKGRLRTGTDGRYEFRTIRPGRYPNARIPQHIHARLLGPRLAMEIPEYWFADDPFVTEQMAAPLKAQGRFSPLVQLTKGSDGVWRGERDIRLPAAGRPR